MNKCKICSNDTTNKKYCSFKCRDIDRHSKSWVKIICKTCGKEVECRKCEAESRKYCSWKCSSSNPDSLVTKLEKRRKTCFEKYGVSSGLQSESVKQKIKTTMMDRYGVDHYSKTDDYKRKMIDTCLTRFGVNHWSKSPSVKEKTRNTVIRKYGGFTLETEEGTRKVRSTCLSKFGVEYPSQNEDIRLKTEATNIERYGSKCPISNKKVQEKSLSTLKKKYGQSITNISQVKEIKDVVVKKCENEFYDSLVSGSRLDGKSKPMFSKLEYTGVEKYKTYSFQCCECGESFKGWMNNGNVPKCRKCFPPLKSIQETMVMTYLKSILSDNEDIICNSRSIINPLELDIYVPSRKLAIEYNGLFWHGELCSNKNENYHLNKSLMCEELGITLIHVFEDEWIHHPDIVKRKIRQSLESVSYHPNHNEYRITEIGADVAKSFLSVNHLSGYSDSDISIGAFDADELVGVMSFSRVGDNEYHVVDVCDIGSGNTPKLMFEKFVQLHSPTRVISNTDRRYPSDCSIYLGMGFKLIRHTPPVERYFNPSDLYDSLYRMNVMEAKSTGKTPLWNPSLTDWKNMKNNGWDRIWDCGQSEFVWP
jgi:hypothetical protein